MASIGEIRDIIWGVIAIIVVIFVVVLIYEISKFVKNFKWPNLNEIGSNISQYVNKAYEYQWGSPPNPSTGWQGSDWSVPPNTTNSQTNLWGAQVCPRGTIYDQTTNSCVPGGQENF